jgi:hypothetical protein
MATRGPAGAARAAADDAAARGEPPLTVVLPGGVELELPWEDAREWDVRLTMTTSRFSRSFS